MSSKFCFDFVHGSAYSVAIAMIGMSLLDFPMYPIIWLMLVTAVMLSCYIRLFEPQRWQHASRVTRFVRYCYFRPIRLLQFCWWIFFWAITGLKGMEYIGDPEEPDAWDLKFTRWQTLEHFWTISRSMADYDMQHWFTIEECKAQLRTKS